MSIGLVLALKAEAHAMLGRGQWQGEGDGECSLRRVRGPRGKSLIAALCGVGRSRAATGTGLLLNEGVEALVGAGISGGLSPKLKAGDLVLASEVMDAGEGREGSEGAYGVSEGALDFALRVLEDSGISVWQGDIISTQSALLDKTSKQDLYEKTGAMAVDMESAGMASVAAGKGLPLFVMRAVCDEAGEAISPDLYACLDAGGGVRPGQLIGSCIRRPAMVAEMMRLRSSYNLALGNLGRGWRVLLKAGFLSYLVSGKIK